MKRRWRLALLVMVLLLIFAARVFRSGIAYRDLHADEAFAAWITLQADTLAQTVRWQPFNWSPFYYVLLELWGQWVGVELLALRLSSVLAFMLGSACLYRAARRLRGSDAAFIAVLAYGAVAYNIFVSTDLRGYIGVLALSPLAFWLTLRYFHRPTWQRAVPLGLSMAALFMSHYTSVGMFAMLGVYTLLVYRRAAWRWWLPGLIALVTALPDIAKVYHLTSQNVPGPLQIMQEIEALGETLSAYAGYPFALALWVALLVLATGLALRARPMPREGWALLVWLVAAPAGLVLSNRGFLLNMRYILWITLGIVLWMGWGLSHLPREGVAGAGVLFAALMILPIPTQKYQMQYNRVPLAASFRWLAENMQWGDVILRDPNWADTPLWSDEFGPDMRDDIWDYLVKVYFPNGVTFVRQPGDHRRVWYFKSVNTFDVETARAVQEGRIAGPFVGPPEGLFRLYEAPPAPEGVPFENGMRFHGADILGEKPGVTVRAEGEPVRVRLWWSVDRPLDNDYSVGLHLYRGDALAGQADGPPQPVDGPAQVSAWEPGRFYVEERTLTVPYPTSSGRYSIYLVVYQWWDGERIAAPGVDGDARLFIRHVAVKAW